MRTSPARVRGAAALGAAMAAACAPPLDPRISAIEAPTVIAVLAEPAEAEPGAAVALTAVVASPAGPAAPAIAWSLCSAPRPPGEAGAVSTACLGDGAREAVGVGAAVVARLPDDSCARFGPDTPPGGFRPRDPDPTGGYYQPVGLEVPGDPERLAFGAVRLLCDLASAPFEVARAYRASYVANRNPGVGPLLAWRAGQRVRLTRAAAGEEVALEVAWPPGDAEAFVALDPATLALVPRREAMQVAWFATAGELVADTTGQAEDSALARSDNRWRAPDAAGEVFLWAVLRDSRGGASVATAAVAVE